jgi:hypothetical protein
MFSFLLGCGSIATLIASAWVWQHAWTVSHSAIHELLAAVLLLIAATLGTGVGIIQATLTGYRRLAERLPPPAPPQRVPEPGTAPVSPPPPAAPALHARATLLAAANALATLTPAERAEADRYVKTLAPAGYPEVIRHSGGWDIMTPGGKIAATVRTMDELRRAVQRLGAPGPP